MRECRIHLAIIFILGLYCAAAAPIQAEKIVIVKSARTMTLLSGSKVLKTYKVALGSVPVGPKRIEGDHKTPEGSYVIDKGCAQPVPFVAAHLLSQRGRSTK